MLAVKGGSAATSQVARCAERTMLFDRAERSAAPIRGHPQGGRRPAGYGRPAMRGRRSQHPSCHLPPVTYAAVLCGSDGDRPRPAGRGSTDGIVAFRAGAAVVRRSPYSGR